jgi:hypothetical protein
VFEKLQSLYIQRNNAGHFNVILKLRAAAAIGAITSGMPALPLVKARYLLSQILSDCTETAE